MKKLAVFVEGQTEQIFVSRMLQEIAGANDVDIINQRGFTKNGKRHFLVKDAKAKTSTPEKKYYVLIRDCGGESQVKSDILENCDSLYRQQYDMILGIRDVYPTFTYGQVAELRKYLGFRVPTKYMPIHILLSIMEIEAWFLAETSHYGRINPAITTPRAISILGFDPRNIDVEQRPSPSNDLNDIYKIAGYAYKKDRKRVQRTVDALDYSIMYLQIPTRISGLRIFC